jgi:hypothetical protein
MESTFYELSDEQMLDVSGGCHHHHHHHHLQHGQSNQNSNKSSSNMMNQFLQFMMTMTPTQVNISIIQVINSTINGNLSIGVGQSNQTA